MVKILRIILIIAFVFSFIDIYGKLTNGRGQNILVPVIILWLSLFIFITVESLKQRVDDSEEKYKEIASENKAISLQSDKLNSEMRSMRIECENTKNEYIETRTKLSALEEIINSKEPFKTVPQMVSDLRTKYYDLYEDWMRNKPRPAISSADVVAQLKKDTKQAIKEEKRIEYKYSFLLNIYPELKKYIDEDEALINLSDFENYESFNNERDRTLDYISEEEYKRLSEDERNQLALDKYKQASKSNWIIGIEYEMYIGHYLRSKGCSVVQYGVERGLQDLGRDIIANKEGKTYIIQCKNWSQNKTIHENVICQLYGTTLEYMITNNTNNIVPVLFTTTELSDMAKKFANKLGVKIKKERKGEYPMIKCKNESRIYHLPFDQQYYHTIIKESEGDFYAWTVDEAARRGYRRAWKWHGDG